MNAAAHSEDLLRTSGLPVFFALPRDSMAGLSNPPTPLGQSVRVYARSLSGMQKEAIVLSALSGRAWRLASDEGPYLNGFDSAPCPLSFLTTGMVCAYMESLLAAARERGVELRNVQLVQDNYYTMRGSALKGTMMGGALPVELEVQLESSASDAQLEELIADAVSAAPIQPLLTTATPSRFALICNGEQISVADVAPLEQIAPAFTWPQGMQPASSEELITRREPVDPHNSGPGGAGTSLAAEQDRKLHVRGICRVRPDGIKEVQQHLFSPRGSVFRYLCEEPSGFGGNGRAPDAASYMAAGVAFCFMTQLGRYAHIVRKELAGYTVVQDVHFPVPGRIAAAQPVDTYVYVDTPEGADFARKLVQMGEQTCFLHAFCRTALTTHVRITRH